MKIASPFIRYVIRRVLQLVLLIVCVIIVNFLLIQLAPGDPIYMFIGESSPTKEYIQMLYERFGLDKPIHIQLLMYIGAVFRGDLGDSYAYQTPVITLIVERIPLTLLLVITSLTWASIIGIVAGVIASTKHRSFIDHIVSISSVVGFSTPSFWLAQMMLISFSLYLNIFPMGGFITLGVQHNTISYILDLLHHLFLPSISLGIWYLALTARMTRSKMLEVLEQNYITLAKSKGLAQKIVVYRHALKNAILPIVTVICMNMGYAMAGSVMVETVYNWPGLGRLMFEASYRRDYPLVMGALFISSVTVVVFVLIADILYLILDPRIRYR